MNTLIPTLLKEDLVFGNNQLDILKKYGTKAAVTDFAILLGAAGGLETVKLYYAKDGYLRKDRTSWWWTQTQFNSDAYIVNEKGEKSWEHVTNRRGGGRPALPYSQISKFCQNKVIKDGILQVEYGFYPQYIANSEYLEAKYKNNQLIATGKYYTTDSINVSIIYNDQKFQSREHIEYEYKGEKYIRFIGDENATGRVLSSSEVIDIGNAYWIHVSPIVWLVDEEQDIALSKKIIFSGVQFKNSNNKITSNYNGNFYSTDYDRFITHYFFKEIIPTNYFSKKEVKSEKTKKKILKIY